MTSNRTCSWILGFTLILLSQAPLESQITGGMLDPAMDIPGQPFCYFWRPNDVIGALFAPVASEVTPEGYIYTGFGELMFFIGNPPQPVDQRIRTLEKGYLPIVKYRVRRDGVAYDFTMFAADLGAGLSGIPVNFVEVRAHNESKEQRAAFLTTAFRFTPPANRFGSALADYRFIQRFELLPKSYTEGQTAFNPNWKYSFASDGLLRDDRILYLFPAQPEPRQFSLAMRDTGLRVLRYFSGEVEGNRDPRLSANPHLPVGLVNYCLKLAPGESRSLAFKMPLAPVPDGSTEARQLRAADYATNLRTVAGSWDELLQPARLRFPEAKLQQALLANTIYDLLAIDKVADDYIPNVNKFQYHRFYGASDTAHMLIALDYLGLTDIAKKGLLYSVRAQAEDGSFIIPKTTGPEYWETFGFTLWGWGRHYLLTRDEDFLRQIYPSIPRAVDWVQAIRKKDSLGLMPVASIADDAMLKNSHQTGQNMWVLIGLKNAITLAEAAGRMEDAVRFKAEYDDYRATFDQYLAIQTAKTGGYISPSLDRTLGGNDWDNLLTLYPEPLFAPDDPRVKVTIERTRARYVEGILPFVHPRAVALKGSDYAFDTTPLLHYWHTPDNAQNALVRGGPEDQQAAVKDLYALLLHTSATHATQEFGAVPWSTRDHSGNNLMPDGPASGKMIELMRNMLVREYQDTLYLLSAVSPSWMMAGKTIEVWNEPTTFGPVSFTLRSNDGGFEMKLSNGFRKPPRDITVCVPWFYEVRQATVDGRPLAVSNGKLRLSPSAALLKVSGRIKQGTPEMSYDRAVEDYKREYRKRYAEFLRTGVTQP